MKVPPCSFPDLTNPGTTTTWPNPLPEHREFWSSRTGFILATVGSAIGLGSIWKFPYEVGAHGGGVFVLCYILGLALIVFPLMLVEFAVGRLGRSDAVESITKVAKANGAHPAWGLIGVVGIVTAFLILSFYSVIGGWAIAYAFETARDGLPGNAVGAVQGHYDQLLASPLRIAAYHACFMAITALVVARGVSGGIEAASKILMPILIVLLAVLTLYAVVKGDVGAALRFFFVIDVKLITPKVVIEALGLGFFSIGVGMAVMVTYAAYSGPEMNLREVALATIIGDTAVSFLAGLAVFPIVFAEKLDPSSGPGLVFVTLPLAFARMPFGIWAAVAFFVLLAVAALGSAISMLEMPVALLRRWLGWSRPAATLFAASLCWFVGLGSVLSFNLWAGWFPLAAAPGLAKATIFDLLDHLTSNVLLPIGGFALAVFGGWAIPAKLLADEIGFGATTTRIIRILLRYVVPLGIAVATLAPLWS